MANKLFSRHFLWIFKANVLKKYGTKNKKHSRSWQLHLVVDQGSKVKQCTYTCRKRVIIYVDKFFPFFPVFFNFYVVLTSFTYFLPNSHGKSWLKDPEGIIQPTL